MAAPPLLEFEKPGRFTVDLGIKVVELGPVGVGRIEALEIADEPGPVKLAGAEAKLDLTPRAPGCVFKRVSLKSGPTQLEAKLDFNGTPAGPEYVEVRKL